MLLLTNTMEDLFKNLSISKKNDDEELTKLFQSIKLNRKTTFKKPHKINRTDNGIKIQKKGLVLRIFLHILH